MSSSLLLCRCVTLFNIFIFLYIFPFIITQVHKGMAITRVSLTEGEGTKLNTKLNTQGAQGYSHHPSQLDRRRRSTRRLVLQKLVNSSTTISFTKFSQL